MPYTSDVPEHVVDLSLSERNRWRRIIEEEGKDAFKLFREALEDYEGFFNPAASPILHRLFGATYKALGGLHFGEMKAWADEIGVNPGLVALMNYSYEISHVIDGMTPYGCTAGAKEVEGVGMVHVRNMDWPVTNIGRATRLFRFIADNHEFLSVGVLGHVGVLSGMIPGKFSVTLNWAPPIGLPRIAHSPAVLLRQALEECEGDLDHFMSVLQETTISCPAFYFVCTPTRAFVIERTQDSSRVRRWSGHTPLAHANHFHTFKEHNASIKVDEGEGTVYNFSLEREQTLRKALQQHHDSFDDVCSVLDEEPVCNEESYQQMAFVPGTGECKVWRWV